MPIAIATTSLPASIRTGTSLSGRILRAILVLEEWSERFHQRRALRELPEHLMHDIAVSPADIEAEASKPFWRA